MDAVYRRFYPDLTLHTDSAAIRYAAAMVVREQETKFTTLDGLRLRGTLALPSDPSAGAAVLVHGGGVTRDEAGFFTRVASGLVDVGVASLRFDLRGHGESEGRQEDLTIASVLNDIRSAIEHVSELADRGSVTLIGTSFAGGICAYFASHHQELVRRLILFNPLLNYKKRFIDDKPYWHNDHISEDAGKELSQNGFIPHNPTFKLGRALLNEIFYLRPHEAIKEIAVPTLIVHGTRDTFIPVESSRECIKQIPAHAQLVEIEGAQHGFAVHDDPRYAEPQTQRWQALVIRSVTDWLTSLA